MNFGGVGAQTSPRARKMRWFYPESRRTARVDALCIFLRYKYLGAGTDRLDSSNPSPFDLASSLDNCSRYRTRSRADEGGRVPLIWLSGLILMGLLVYFLLR